MESSITIFEDLVSLLDDSSIPWDEIKGKSVLITGATGLIGSLLVKTLILANKRKSYDIKVLALCRSEDKFNSIFFNYKDSSNLYPLYNFDESLLEIDNRIDYIIHCASNTSSKDFVEKPVEVIKTTVWNTDLILRLAKQKRIKSMVYLSSMEVYGVFKDKEFIDEEDLGYIDIRSARSSYPQSKRSAESLCYSYFSEHGVQVKIARPTLTFGPGVASTDNRVFAQFCKNAISGKNIVLHTKGNTKRDYLYTSDAVSALLIMLIKGESGEAYNISNNETYCSIYEFACLVSSFFNNVHVVFDIPSGLNSYGYAPELKIKLNNNKLKEIGWKPKLELNKMLERIIRYYKEVNFIK